jgi:non-heme chloroperoxidase
MIDRRMLLGAGLMAGVSPSLPLRAAPLGLAGLLPLEIFTRIRCTPEGRSTWWWYTGHMLGRLHGEPARPMLSVQGASRTRITRQSDGSIVYSLIEAGYYGEPLNPGIVMGEMTNVLTGKTMVPEHYLSPQVLRFRPDLVVLPEVGQLPPGLDYKGRITPPDIKGDRTWMAEELFVKGSPILLIHGFSFGANAFKHQIGDIAARHRLIALDLRGHGLSAKPWAAEAYTDRAIWAADIAAVLKSLNVERPLIIGWSFGGYVALNYLRQCGSGCARGLVLTGSVAGLVPAAPSKPAPGMPPPKGDARADNYHAFFDAAEWLSRVMTNAPPPPAEAMQKQMTVTMMAPMIRRAMTGLQLDNKDLAPKLTLPVLFIHGLADGSVPPATISAAAASLPAARAIGYENTGHSAFAEQPRRFNADIMAFAKSLE